MGVIFKYTVMAKKFLLLVACLLWLLATLWALNNDKYAIIFFYFVSYIVHCVRASDFHFSPIILYCVHDVYQTTAHAISACLLVTLSYSTPSQVNKTK